MYEILKKGESPIIESNLFYEGDTSIIYKLGNELYKIYTKKEPFKRQVLDYLIKRKDIYGNIAVFPKAKLKLEDNYGMKMDYIESTDLLSYMKQKSFSTNELIRILRIASSNLKQLNAEKIRFSDLHHHNIVIRKDGYPMFIDLDDAVVDTYPSYHIACMVRNLHEIGQRFDYEDKLINEGNLDCECLYLMLLDYIFKEAIERNDRKTFIRKISELEPYTNKIFIETCKELKRDETVIGFPHYVGDFLTEENANGLKQFVKERTKK